MTDELDSLLKQLADDVADDGFSESVMSRIQQAKLIRRGLSAGIAVAMTWLFIGPLPDLLMLVSGRLATAMGTWFDTNWLVQNQAILIASIACGTIPIIFLALEE